MTKSEVLKYITPTDIRQDFCLRLERRLLAMAKGTCECSPRRESGHLMPCPGYYREDDARIVRMMFEEIEESEA